MLKMETVKQKSGIILIDKTIGPTSRQIVNAVSFLLHTKKVGHVGTLDPFASGLLILTVNHATKIGSYLETLDKTYVAKIKLGDKTDTGDLTGQIIASHDVPRLINKQVISDVLQSFLGKRQQIPPMFSALKRDGKPLYKYAREGKTLKREPRDILIHEIMLLSFDVDTIEFQARVSKGTYVRTLGEEIAEALGTVGHLISLRRVAIGVFDVAEAINVDDVSNDQMIDIVSALKHMRQVAVEPEQVKDIKNARPISLNVFEEQVLLVSDKEALAIYERRDDGLYYSRRGLFFWKQFFLI